MRAPTSDHPVLPDRYRVIRRLGGGGSAEVLLAEDRAGEPARKAVKVLRADLPRGAVAALRNEFRILASLNHPGLARVFELGELADGRAYYTADFVEGRELGRGGPASVRQVCVAAAAVCRTLAYLHARGYAHNDVKPANILVPDEGDGAEGRGARLLDFGLAGLKLGARRSAVAGTPGYIAPERLAGGAAGERSDLYSLGATLYRVLGGRRVTERAEPTEALAALRRGWRPLASLRPDLPEALAALVEQLLAFDPAARPPHPYAVIARLGEVVGTSLPYETPGSARCYALASVLVGRDREMGELDRGLREAITGKGPRLLAVAGPPGTGKSRLTRELELRAEAAGLRVASVSCSDRSPLAEPLLRLGEQLGVAGPAGDARDTAADPAERLIAAGSGAPRVLVVDDAHRASGLVWGTLLAVARLGAERGVPLAVVVSFDPASMPDGARQALALATASADVVRVELGALTRAELRHMLGLLFGEGVIPSSMQDELARRSGGNPLLLEESVRELVETGRLHSGPAGWTVGSPAAGAAAPSERLDAFLRRRCEGLPPAARAALEALAALGGRAELPSLAAVAGGAAEMREGVALLADRNLVALRGETVALEHERLADLGLEGLPPARRASLHRAAAAELRRTGASDGELARATLAAGDPGAALEHAFRAATAAIAAAERRPAWRWLEEALAIARTLPGSREGRLADVLAGFVGEQSFAGRFGEALATAEEAWALMADAPGGGGRRRAGSRARRRVLLAEAAAMAALRGSLTEACQTWQDRIDRAAAGAGPELEARALRIAAVSAYYRRELGRARELFQRARELLEASGGTDPETASILTLVLSNLATVTMQFDIDEARACVRAAVAAGQRADDYNALGIARNNFAICESICGEIVAGVAMFKDLLGEATRLRDANGLPLLLINLASGEYRLGAWEDARRHLRQAMEMAGDSSTPLAVAQAESAIGAWIEGDMALLAREAPRALETASGVVDSLVQLLCSAAAGAAERRAAGEAAALAARARAEADRSTAPMYAAEARVVEAYAAAAADAGEGGRLLRQAADDLERLGNRINSPQILRDAGRWLARAGDRAGAEVCFVRARAVLESWGARPAVERLDALVAALDGEAAASGRTALSDARSLDDLGRLLRDAAAAAGIGARVQLFGLLDGEVRPLGEVALDRDAADEAMATAVRAALRAGQDRREGGASFYPLQAGPLATCLVLRGDDPGPAAGLLVQAARATLALLAERGRRPADPPGGALEATPTRVDDRSQAVELTVGPVELRPSFPGVVGRSPALGRALALLERLSGSEAPVLLVGETGTGKEVFARALHESSPRARGPFVAVNCAAIPEALFEAEMFGYTRGAFTGAVQDHAGFAEQAARGTLFLDEVAELPPRLQPKLLRMLQERLVRPVGATRDVRIDVRLCAASNRDLAAEVEAGRFRADLYYRLNVMELRLPPLRERAGDVPELCRHLLGRMGRASQPIGRTAMRRLTAYPWPGNVRELENELQRASVLAGSGPIQERHLSPGIVQGTPRGARRSEGTLAETMAAHERRVIQEAVRRAGGNLTRAAAELGLSRPGLLKARRRLGLARGRR